MLKRIRGFSRPQTQHSPIHLEDDVFFHPLGRKQPLRPFWGPGKLVCPDKCSGEYAPTLYLVKNCNSSDISLHLFFFRKRLFAGGPPANKKLFAGGSPANKNLFAGGPLANKNLFARTLSVLCSPEWSCTVYSPI